MTVPAFLFFSFAIFIAPAWSLLTQCPTFFDGMVSCEYITDYGFPLTTLQTNVTAACSYHGCTNYNDTPRILQLASQAANTAISVYSAFAVLPTTVLYWPVKNGKGLANTWTVNGVCITHLYIDQLAKQTDQKILQDMAHEMYHCVQELATTFPTGHHSGYWWIEGTAEYMSTVVYPTADESGFDQQYLETDPLYIQPYSDNIFFASMGMDATPAGVNTWMKSQTIAPDISAERTRISQLVGFRDIYETFAERYALGTIDCPPPVSTPVPINLFAPPSQGIVFPSTTFTLSMRPFAIGGTLFTLNPGQTVQIYYTTHFDGVTLMYRNIEEKGFSALPSSGEPLEEASITLPCDGDAVTIEVLMTSTDDADKVSAVVIIDQTTDPQCCQNCATQPSTSPISTLPPRTVCNTIGTSLGSDATPCFSGPAASFGNNCFYEVSCWPTAWTSIETVVPQPYTALCGSLGACSTSTATNPENYGYLTMLEVHCSACGVATTAGAAPNTIDSTNSASPAASISTAAALSNGTN